MDRLEHWADGFQLHNFWTIREISLQCLINNEWKITANKANNKWQGWDKSEEKRQWKKESTDEYPQLQINLTNNLFMTSQWLSIV